MEIKLFINNKAKQIIRKTILKEINNTDDNKEVYDLILRWLNEKNNVKCFILYENDILKSFVLLSKCDYDPLKTHNNPYILDFIYTFTSYRHNNLAYKLLLHIKKISNITAFCSNDESIMLFKKAEYIQSSTSGYTTFRYPK